MNVVLILDNYVVGLVATSPVMEVEVVSQTPARSLPGILTGKLLAQLPVHVTSHVIV